MANGPVMAKHSSACLPPCLPATESTDTLEGALNSREGTINKQVRENKANLGYLVLAASSICLMPHSCHTPCPPSIPPAMLTLTPQLTFDIVAHTPRMLPLLFHVLPLRLQHFPTTFISSPSYKNSTRLCLGAWQQEAGVAAAKRA